MVSNTENLCRVNADTPHPHLPPPPQPSPKQKRALTSHPMNQESSNQDLRQCHPVLAKALAARRAAADAPRSPQAKSAESRFSSGPSGKDKTWAVYKEVEAPVLVVNRSGHMGPGASAYRGKPEKSQCTNQELKGGVRIHRVRIRVVVVGTRQTVRELTSVRRRQEGADAVNLKPLSPKISLIYVSEGVWLL